MKSYLELSANNERNKSNKVSVGISLVLVVFVVLCLVTFSTLSYVTAKADFAKTQQAKETFDLYIDAVNRVEEKIGSLDISSYEVDETIEIRENINENLVLDVVMVVVEENGIKTFDCLKWASVNAEDGSQINFNDGSMELMTFPGEE